MKRLITLAALAALAACTKPAIRTEDGGAADRTVELMAVAPDGTHLWRFDTGDRYVYFASSGAGWTENCGKNCRRDVQVPTADPLQAVQP